MKKTKRFFAIVMSVMLMAGMMTATAFAAEDTGSEETVKIVSYEGFTERDENNPITNGMGTGDEQILKVYLTFEEEMKIIDEAALISELQFKFGPPSYNASEITLTDGGKTLEITYKGFVAAYNGIFAIDVIAENLVSADTGAKAEMKTSFVVPNGTGTAAKEQVIAAEGVNASVTTQITYDSEVTRGMVHMVLLKNGKPAAATNMYGGHIVGHWHDYMNLTGEKFAGMVKGWFDNSFLAGDYTISVDGDTVTITANNSEPGDVLELHIASYLNSGVKTIDISELEALIEEAEGLDTSLYTEESIAEMMPQIEHQIELAKVITADTTYYAQTDVDAASDRLQAAIDGLVKIQTEDNETGNNVGTDNKADASANENTPADNVVKTGDDMPFTLMFVIMFIAALAAVGALRYKRI